MFFPTSPRVRGGIVISSKVGHSQVNGWQSFEYPGGNPIKGQAMEFLLFATFVAPTPHDFYRPASQARRGVR